MLNKKKVAAAIAIFVIILVLIISAIFAGLNKGTKVAKLSKKIEKSHEYKLEMKDESNYEIVISEKNNQTAIDMNNNGERVTTVIKDGVEYLILHEQREYYAYNSETEQAIVTDTLKDLGKADSTGKEKINGKTYKYEEYHGFEGFMTSTGLETDEEHVSTRFYFKGNNLVYIKTMVEGQEDELLEIKITYSVPDELFEIPSDYTEASYENQNDIRPTE
ncbi:MAG: hypothetical protein IKF17_03980 [Clostridia bacterium]|nr:hypothetical protein [Clostridia bacterium]